MKKRVTSVLLVVLLLMVQVPSAFALTESGKCGDNLTWTLDDSGTLTISGTGDMDNWDGGNDYAPWYPAQNYIRKVIIANGVTNIGTWALENCVNLTNITIPDSVTRIGEYAFYHCQSLENVTIPNGVTKIEHHVFDDCASLTNITIPNSVTTIEYCAFDSCVNLTSVTIPNSVTTIELSAFDGCASLTSVTIPNSVTKIGNHAFSFCFSLTDIKIPNKITTIEDGTFDSCFGLQNVTIPNSVTSIEQWAFLNCDNLTNITIPKSVSKIGKSAFSKCDSLTNVYYGGSQSQWKAIKIDDENECLTNATIHYNSSGSALPRNFPPALEPVAPTPTPTANSDISKYSYAFDNSAKSFGYPIEYKIPLSSFQLIFGETALAKHKCEQFWNENKFWGGSCYGISATVGMFVVSGNGVTPSGFRSGATRPGDLAVSDVHTEWGLTLTKFIEAMQISQYSSMTAITLKRNRNNLSALTSAVSTFENGGGGPVLICVYGPDRNGRPCGHALLAYHLDGERLYVYDCNTPNDGTRYITISGNKWSYPIFDGVTWSNSNGSITYIPYESYLSDWINRGHVQNLEYVSLVANVSAATVRDSAGKEVAVFQNGQMTRGSDNAYPFTPLGITPDGVSTAPPQVSVWLPVDEVYTVTNQDASKTSYEVSLCNVNQGVSVETTSATVQLSAEDSTNMNLAIINGTNCDYIITQISGQDEIKFQGKTARDKVHALLENGVSSSSGITSSTSVTINGKAVSVNSFMNGTSVNIASASTNFDDVSPGQYFYDPVMWAVGRGITNGTTPTTFSPHNTCSRNHILTFLWRANGSPAASVRNPFTDIDTNKDFGKAALWAYEKGLVSGTKFNGNTPCSRADVVTYLWKLAGRPSAGGNRFSDVPTGAEYASAVSWAVQQGITKGTSETTFNPSGTCTRGQIVTFLYRAYADE